MHRIVRLACASGIGAMIAVGPGLASDHGNAEWNCTVEEKLTEAAPPLPRAAKSIAASKTLKIVALGSSSTLGTGGSGASTAWPARLEAELKQRLAGVDVTVVNKGLMRQSVPQMLARIQRDVIAQHPDLVVWEAGTSEAVRGVDVEMLTEGLLTGIDKLSQAGIEIILMDMQYARNTARLINFQPYVEAVDRAAAMRDVYVFPRHELMRQWVESEQVRFEDKTLKQAVRLADDIYACIAKNLAAVIAHSVLRN
jgi:Lysophospholipase L1 and related esterases